MPVDVLHEAGAVEALWCGSTPDVRDAEILLAVGNHSLGGAGGVGVPRRPDRSAAARSAAENPAAARPPGSGAAAAQTERDAGAKLGARNEVGRRVGARSEMGARPHLAIDRQGWRERDRDAATVAPGLHGVSESRRCGDAVCAESGETVWMNAGQERAESEEVVGEDDVGVPIPASGVRIE